MTPNFEVRMFGGLDVRLGDKPLPPLRSRREQWLLALLVLRHDRDTARDWLASTLWQDNDEQQALFYLRKSLSNLRQALGAEAARLLSPTPRTVRLDIDGAFVDVAAFDGALRSGALQEAVAQYHGSLLPDCPEEWAAAERNQREQAYLSALEALAANFQERGDPASAVHWLRLLIAADPYRESAYCSLMTALADCGDLAAVRVIYQDLRSQLRQELNAAPSPEIEALYKRLTSAERPAVSLPPQEPAPTRRHLPVPLSDLIGRENEIAELLVWMKRRRLITLVGTGGIGKTRLAIAVADAAQSRFEDGVWFVDLQALTDPALVPQITAKALGIDEEPNIGLTETVETALATRTLLLVLDNCEHLPEACATLAHRLLSACPALVILATSRQALQVTGEQIYAVPTLPVPPGGSLGDDASPDSLEKDPHFLMEYDAIRLFVDRALRVNSTFRLNPRNAAAVVAICGQLDGIPLAIEMAAARLRTLSAGEIRTRLADRFRLLTTGNRGALPRQQTLRAAIDWSYDQLSDPERTLLGRLSVFAGGWTAEAAEAVCGNGETDVLETLAALVEKSLITRAENGENSIRYGMLETIRQYARERMESATESAETCRKHLRYFLTMVEVLRPKLISSEAPPALSALDADHDNIRQALAFCRDEPGLADDGLRLSADLWRFWLARGHLNEGRRQFADALSLPAALAPTKLRVDALHGAGALAFFQGDFAASRKLHEEGLAIGRALGDPESATRALVNLGNIAATIGDYATARSNYEPALQYYRASGRNEQGLRNVLNNLGNVLMELGDYDTARGLQEEGLTLCREIGDLQGVANSLNNVGIIVQMQGDLAAARVLFTESLAIHRETGPITAEASNLAGLGNVAFLQGDFLSARSYYEESLTIRKKFGDQWGAAISLQGLGSTAVELGEYFAARSLLAESLTIRQSLGDLSGTVEAFDALASLAQREENHARAVELWGAASALRESLSSTPLAQRREELEREWAAAQAAIGEKTFCAAWEMGRARSLEEAVQYAQKGADEAPMP